MFRQIIAVFFRNSNLPIIVFKYKILLVLSLSYFLYYLVCSKHTSLHNRKQKANKNSLTWMNKKHKR